MPFKNLIVLLGLVALGYLFFGLTLNNEFWHGDDFISLERSIQLLDDPLAAFDSQVPFKFQPLVYGIYYMLFRTFHFEARGYFIFNILLHGLNSFFVYILVYTLLKDRTVALVSGLLFVFTVGSYGKSVMIVSGLEDLIITTFTLLTMIFYFKNELEAGGRMLTPWFALALILFMACMLTRSTSFSILGAFFAFNYFFHEESKRRLFSMNFLILLAIAVSALVVKTKVFHYFPIVFPRNANPASFVFYTLKSIISYIVRMIFPIHTSHLVAESGPAVRFVFRFATAIRIFSALTVISYSFFGFVFGNRTIRFFIAWTYIMVLPFSFFRFPSDWLNIRHLYIVSVGFVLVISSGSVYCSRLIARHRWKRLVPLVVPIFFILLARFIITQLDHSYESKAAGRDAAELREELAQKYPFVLNEGGRLIFDRNISER